MSWHLPGIQIFQTDWLKKLIEFVDLPVYVKSLVYTGGTMAEHSAHNPKIQGSNPATERENGKLIQWQIDKTTEHQDLEFQNHPRLSKVSHTFPSSQFYYLQ